MLLTLSILHILSQPRHTGPTGVAPLHNIIVTALAHSVNANLAFLNKNRVEKVRFCEILIMENLSVNHMCKVKIFIATIYEFCMFPYFQFSCWQTGARSSPAAWVKCGVFDQGEHRNGIVGCLWGWLCRDRATRDGGDKWSARYCVILSLVCICLSTHTVKWCVSRCPRNTS